MSCLPNAQKIARLTPLKVVLDRIASTVGSVAAREIALAEAVGRVLAEDATAGAAHPMATIALRDGFAVRAEDTADASSYAPVPLPHALAVQIGDGMPEDADAVASPDAIMVIGDSLAAVAPLAVGDGVLAAGADAQQGMPLRRAGEKLRQIDVAVLQALGVAQVKVRAPRVRVMAAKDDDIVIDAIAGFSRRIITAGGGHVVADHASVDVEEALGAAGAEFIIVVGGSGVGVRDNSINRLAAAGQLHFHGIGILPGETSALGFLDTVPVLIVPGRLDAAFAAFATVGEPIMARLCGLAGEAVTIAATLERKVVSTIGLVEVVPVQLRNSTATPLAAGYFPMQAMTKADGYVVVPADSEGFPAGTIVSVRVMP